MERERHRDAGRVSVLERVRERLLDDAKDGELDAAGQRLWLAGHLEPYRESGGAVARDEPIEVRERRLRTRLGAPVGLAQQREDPAQLGQALFAARLDAGECLVGHLG